MNKRYVQTESTAENIKPQLERPVNGQKEYGEGTSQE
jgi:hypothetical protein